MRLAAYADLSRFCNEKESSISFFKSHSIVSELRWPDDVLEQWLYDHAANESFLRDYGNIDLSTIGWDVEAISAKDFIQMPTGRSDGDCMESMQKTPTTGSATVKAEYIKASRCAGRRTVPGNAGRY
ncbi:hypothetical protein Q0Z83_000230 [Actinoplanes sichuanensis]|nr:hypothetical protein Q0Z83_000230 [Actinoplanes sichuanensis]